MGYSTGSQGMPDGSSDRLPASEAVTCWAVLHKMHCLASHQHCDGDDDLSRGGNSRTHRAITYRKAVIPEASGIIGKWLVCTVSEGRMGRPLQESCLLGCEIWGSGPSSTALSEAAECCSALSVRPYICRLHMECPYH